MRATALKPRRIPALLAFLLALFLALPAADARADIVPGAIAPANPVVFFELEAESENPAQPGDADLWDSGDAAFFSSAQFSGALSLGQAIVHAAHAIHSSRFTSYRARAPPSL